MVWRISTHFYSQRCLLPIVVWVLSYRWLFHPNLIQSNHLIIIDLQTFIFSRFASRSATATPTGSPKKRQLPQIPAKLHEALKDRVAQDHEERARLIKYRNRQLHTTYRSTEMGGEIKFYSILCFRYYKRWVMSIQVRRGFYKYPPK